MLENVQQVASEGKYTDSAKRGKIYNECQTIFRIGYRAEQQEKINRL